MYMVGKPTVLTVSTLGSECRNRGRGVLWPALRGSVYQCHHLRVLRPYLLSQAFYYLSVNLITGQLHDSSSQLQSILSVF